jgi:hypothetical protein
MLPRRKRPRAGFAGPGGPRSHQRAWDELVVEVPESWTAVSAAGRYFMWVTR